MFRTFFQFISTSIILIGLAWVYTLLYGGPFVPFFIWLLQHLPPPIHINVTPAPLSQ